MAASEDQIWEEFVNKIDAEQRRWVPDDVSNMTKKSLLEIISYQAGLIPQLDKTKYYWLADYTNKVTFNKKGDFYLGQFIGITKELQDIETGTRLQQTNPGSAWHKNVPTYSKTEVFIFKFSKKSIVFDRKIKFHECSKLNMVEYMAGKKPIISKEPSVYEPSVIAEIFHENRNASARKRTRKQKKQRKSTRKN
jgi:hypothetical protein